ncbi:hypothetical protein QUB76_33775, partial [Microcoleus sp. D2B6]|uniref:hypothetical protein n=2 Tax=Microcoleus TaxID=44471 RepID=UPI002FD09567
SRPSKKDGRDAHPTNLWKLFNSHSLVRELKLQNQRDFKLRLEHDRRHEFKTPKTCFYSALHLN